MPNEKSVSPSSRIGAEKVVVTKAMLDVGYDILDEYLLYNSGSISRFTSEEVSRAVCLYRLQEPAVESNISPVVLGDIISRQVQQIDLAPDANYCAFRLGRLLLDLGQHDLPGVTRESREVDLSLVHQIRLYAQAVHQALGCKSILGGVLVAMNLIPLSGKPEMVNRCCVIMRGGEMLFNFTPNGLENLRNISVERIYVSDGVLLIHEGELLHYKELQSSPRDDYAACGDRNGLPGAVEKCPIKLDDKGVGSHNGLF